jgi:ferredoxin-NADP reductase
MSGTPDMSDMPDMLELVVASVTSLTPAIKAFVLRSANGAPLPPFTPGAHLGVQVMQPNGHAGQRAYSLARPHRDEDCYEIAVLHEPQGAGGSAWMHGLTEGAALTAHAPRNDFVLHKGNAAPLLIAGGIGITPLLCMARALAAEGQAFEFVYATRSEEATAYLQEVCALGGHRAPPARLRPARHGAGRGRHGPRARLARRPRALRALRRCARAGR